MAKTSVWEAGLGTAQATVVVQVSMIQILNHQIVHKKNIQKVVHQQQ